MTAMTALFQTLASNYRNVYFAASIIGMKTSCLFLFLIFAIMVSAQKTEQGFDHVFKPTKHAPRYLVVTEKKDSLWHRQAWYVTEYTQALDGWYKDEECKIAHGIISWYHPNRMIKTITNYSNGLKEGVALEFDEEGLMRDSANYVADKLMGVRMHWHKNGMASDSMNFDGRGNGAEVAWYEDGTPSFAGYWVSDTLKKGTWKYYHANGKLRLSEQYAEGKLVSANCFDEAGQPIDSAICAEEKEAEFPGGLTAWKKFIERTLNANVPAKNKAPDGQYTVVMQFIVGKDGKLTGIKPRTHFGFGMEEEAERMLQRSPKWTPARQHGRTVNAYRLQPLTFVVQTR